MRVLAFEPGTIYDYRKQVVFPLCTDIPYKSAIGLTDTDRSFWLLTDEPAVPPAVPRWRTRLHCDGDRMQLRQPLLPDLELSSPLALRLYMRRFVLGWKHLGYAKRFGAQIVTYAGDLVICCKSGAEEALPLVRQIMARLKLTVNEEKTHVRRVPEQHFEFLGYTFGRVYSTKTGRAYLGTRPSKKSVANRRLMFQLIVTRSHSPWTLASPHKRNWRKPMADLMMPNTGSGVCLRSA